MKNTLQKANPALKHFLQSFFIKATDAVTHAEESLKDKDHVASPVHHFTISIGLRSFLYRLDFNIVVQDIVNFKKITGSLFFREKF